MAGEDIGDFYDLPEVTAKEKQKDDEFPGSDAWEGGAGRPSLDKVVCLIEEQAFIRDVIRIGLKSVSEYDMFAYRDVGEFRNDANRMQCHIVIVTLFRFDELMSAAILDKLQGYDTRIPVLVLGPPKPRLVVLATSHGAKGYIPYNAKFEVMTEVIRVIIAGGTYAPLELFHSLVSREGSRMKHEGDTLLTPREIAVVQAMKQGKSNKLIAYGLTMTESTVKSHIRNIMTKLRVKSRLEIAIMPEEFIFGLREAGGV